MKALYFITQKTYQSVLSSYAEKNNLVKFVLPPLKRQSAQDILQLLLRSELTPQCQSIRLFPATAFQESCLVYFLRCNCKSFRSKTKVKVNEKFFKSTLTLTLMPIGRTFTSLCSYTSEHYPHLDRPIRRYTPLADVLSRS